MHRKMLWTLLLATLVAGSAADGQSKSAPPAAAPAKKAEADGWPATRAGAIGRGWVTAFSTGEAEMKAFLSKELAPKSLETKSVAQRVERYRDLREQYGRLDLASVVKSTPGELTVKLMDSDARFHEFVFTVQTEQPYKLLTVGIKQRGHFGMGGHGGH